MIQSINNKLPLLVSDEKEAMLSSIVNMLREKGFVVIRQAQTQLNNIEQGEILKLDGLNLLRFVTQNWDQAVPVVIATAFETQISNKVVLAA